MIRTDYDEERVKKKKKKREEGEKKHTREKRRQRLPLTDTLMHSLSYHLLNLCAALNTVMIYSDDKSIGNERHEPNKGNTVIRIFVGAKRRTVGVGGESFHKIRLQLWAGLLGLVKLFFIIRLYLSAQIISFYLV